MKPHLVLAGSAAALAALVFLAPPVAQPLIYHDFADRRTCFGIPNCLDTASNMPFVLAGAYGLHCLRILSGAAGPRAFIDARETVPYALFFLAVVLIGFASAWYHLAPDNARLAWDRAAMALAFMAWFVALLAERVGVKAGLMLLAPLCAAGLGAVFYWSWSETQGAGDLRPWLLVQLVPILLVPLLLWLYPPRYSRGRDALAVVGLYLVALLLHVGDRAVFALTGGAVGGHALKHIVAALAAWKVARHLLRRRPA
ncbi:hypothetical protein [Thauera sp.]|uniref:hypothetical protein n=1 Tax=Thauera sp. TaxID=1905334 RepID=UPI002588F16B|nr:hypothetical protein [Thauera sp.]